jgi:Homing endonuclease associated repeat
MRLLQVNPSRRARDRTTIALVPAKGELGFEMNHLLSYDDDSLIEEIRRVAALAPGTRLTRNAFDRLSRAASSIIVRRFGGWQSALDRAGLAGRYSGASVTGKMRRQQGRTLTVDEIVVELQRLAADKGQPTITMHDLRSSDLLSERVVIKRFGTWRAALEAAGLQLSSRGRRWTDEDYFENLLTVWTHYGRAPRYGEMDKPPSRISSGAYESKFGSWGRAKQPTVEGTNTRPLQGDRAFTSGCGHSAISTPR